MTDRKISQVIDFLRSQSGADKLGDKKLENQIQINRFHARIDTALNKTFRQHDSHHKNPKLNPKYKPLKTLSYDQWTQYTPESCTKLFTEIIQQTKSKETQDENPLVDEYECISDELYESNKQVELSPNQLSIIDQIISTVNSKKQFLGLLVGEPGAGKSTTVRNLKNRLESQTNKIKMLLTATTGVAATELEKGQTINSVLKLGINKPYVDLTKKLSDEKLIKIRKNFEGVQFLVIDECSMLTATALSTIDAYLKQAFKSTELFGGLHVLLVGDFFQFPPTSHSPSLYNTAVKLALGRKLTYACITQGGKIFTKFKRFVLKDQNRCKSDSQHKKLIKQMRNLKKQFPITKKMIKQLKVLKQKDLDDPDWNFAPIIVTSNVTRHRINNMQVKRFAKYHNEKIFKWKCPVAGSYDIYETKNTEKQYPELTQYFVRGAKVVLGDNIYPQIGLANGSVGTLEALCWENQDDIPDYKSTKSVIEVKQPAFIIVKFGDKIVPIKTKTLYIDNPIHKQQKKSKQMNKKYDVHPEKINYIGHPIELLFSITFHKTQSKTLKKLILCINKCQSRKILPISINSLIVGTSRVQNGNNLRVLAYNDYDLNHLTKLKHNVLLKKWDDNYDKNGIWQPEKLNKVKKSALNSALLELSFVKNLNDLTVDQLYYYLTQLDIYFDKSVDKKKNLIEKLSEKYKDAKEMFSEEKKYR